MGSKQAVEGKRINAFGMDPDTLIIIGLDTEDGPEHPLYDKRIKLPLDDNMVKNVKTFGVKETIIVTKDADRVLVVDGRQRVRWARTANELIRNEGGEPIFVPALVERGDEKKLYGTMISTNEVRQDDDVLTKAEKAAKFIGMGHTVDEAAVVFGVTKRAVEIWMQILDLSAAVKKAIAAGKLSASAAKEFSGLSKEEQEKKLDELVTESTGTKRISKGATRKKTKGSAAPGKKRIKAVADNLKHPYSTILGWVLGELSDAELCSEVPALVKGFEAKE